MTRLTEMHQEQEEEGEEGKFSVAVIRDTLLFAVRTLCSVWQQCWGTDERRIGQMGGKGWMVTPVGLESGADNTVPTGTAGSVCMCVHHTTRVVFSITGFG